MVLVSRKAGSNGGDLASTWVLKLGIACRVRSLTRKKGGKKVIGNNYAMAA